MDRPPATYYLSPTGNDAASGALAAPWRSIEVAAGRMQPGDTLVLRGGRYAERSVYEMRRSGEPGKPLRFVAFPGEIPTLDLLSVGDGLAHDTLQIFGSYLEFEGLRVENHNQPGQGIWIDYDAHDVVLRYLEVAYPKGSGVMLAGHHCLVDGTWIYGAGDPARPPLPGEHGIYLVGHHNVLRGNVVHNNWTHGIQVYTEGGGAEGNLVEENYVFHNGYGSVGQRASAETAGIVVGLGTSGTIVRNNRICDNAGYGVMVGDSAPRTEVRGNITCFNARGGIYVYEPGAATVLNGNISYNDRAFALWTNPGSLASDQNSFFASGGAPRFHFDDKRNLTLPQFQAQSRGDAGSRVHDPGFANLPTDVFRWADAESYDFTITSP